MPRLLRLIVRNVPLWPFRLAEPRRMSSPVGGSTLMTSAPMSARFIEQNGAAMACVRSMTRRPASAFIRSPRWRPAAVAPAARARGSRRAFRRMSSSSASFIWRTGLAGTPITSVPAGTTLPWRHQAPAPTWALSSMTAPVRTIAPMPMRTLLPMVQACTTAAVADGHALADDAGRLRLDVHDRVVLHVGVAADADVLALSPRTTAKGQTLTPSASSTLPMTSAAGSTQAPGWIRGVWPGTERTVTRRPCRRAASAISPSTEAELAQDRVGVLAERGRHLGHDAAASRDIFTGLPRPFTRPSLGCGSSCTMPRARAWASSSASGTL